MLASPDVSAGDAPGQPEPFCGCWAKKAPISWKQLDPCSCGEVAGAECEWLWETPQNNTTAVVLTEDRKQVTFHPYYSTGTAVVKGDTPLVHNVHYYWEVKVLTEAYGTDTIIGVGTNKMDVVSSQYVFTSLLGSTEESYGLSYKGRLRHMDWEISDTGGFSRGTVVGVRVDMWRGTLEFYINRRPQGISFYNLRRHEALYPMVSSTAAQSSMRLVYAGSHRGTLLVDALKILMASARRAALPPGLAYTTTTKFWLSLPTDGPAIRGKPRREVWYSMPAGSMLSDADPPGGVEPGGLVVSTPRFFLRPAPLDNERGGKQVWKPPCWKGNPQVNLQLDLPPETPAMAIFSAMRFGVVRVTPQYTRDYSYTRESYIRDSYTRDSYTRNSSIPRRTRSLSA